MKNIYLLFIALLVSCSHSPFGGGEHRQTIATIWMQNAAEVKALDLQAYNMAKVSLDRELRKKSKKPLAVILDIDETTGIPDPD